MLTANKLIVATLLLFFSPSFVLANECFSLFVQNKILSESEMDTAIRELRGLRQQRYSTGKGESLLAQNLYKEKHNELLKFLSESEIQSRMRNLVTKTITESKKEHKSKVTTEEIMEVGPYLNEAREFLEEAGSTKSERNNEAVSAAISDLRLELIPALIHLGAKINGKNSNGEPTLVVALNRQDITLEHIKMLVRLGADVNGVGSAKETPLDAAAGIADFETIAFLLDSGAKPKKSFDLDGTIADDTPVNLVKMLIENGVNLNFKSKNTGNSLLHTAATFDGNAPVIEYLVSIGLRVNVKNSKKQTALFNIAADVDAIETLIRLGIDVNAKDENGLTALHIAATFMRAPVVEALVKGGADLHAVDNKNKTPLKSAQGRQMQELLKKLGAKK